MAFLRLNENIMIPSRLLAIWKIAGIEPPDSIAIEKSQRDNAIRTLSWITRYSKREPRDCRVPELIVLRDGHCRSHSVPEKHDVEAADLATQFPLRASHFGLPLKECHK